MLSNRRCTLAALRPHVAASTVNGVQGSKGYNGPNARVDGGYRGLQQPQMWRGKHCGRWEVVLQQSPDCLSREAVPHDMGTLCCCPPDIIKEGWD